ncbi:hypothetical protein KM043_010715 [Ampulex compressa]|nr:hypothetical protein KM043_010715 [Ampulex compressa]
MGLSSRIEAARKRNQAECELRGGPNRREIPKGDDSWLFRVVTVHRGTGRKISHFLGKYRNRAKLWILRNSGERMAPLEWDLKEDISFDYSRIALEYVEKEVRKNSYVYLSRNEE